MFVYTVKHIYKGQPLGTTKVAFVDRWPLFRTSETTYLMFTEKIKMAFVNRKPCPYAQILL